MKKPSTNYSKQNINDMLCSGYVYSVIDALIYCASNRVKDDFIVKEIINLQKDDYAVGGYRICDIATSVLDILDVEKYNGNDKYIRDMIKSIKEMNKK